MPIIVTPNKTSEPCVTNNLIADYLLQPMTTTHHPKFPFVSHVVTPATLVVAALLCFLVMIGYFLHSSYQRAIVDAESNTRNLVGVIESRLSSEFSRVDGMLTFVAHGVQSDPFHSRSVAVSSEQTQHLALMVKSFPQMAGLFAFDADGTMKMSSDPGVKPFSAAGRPHFQTLRVNPNTSLEFSEPIVSRSAGKWSMIQSRSIRDDAGKFLGSVSGVHHIDTFSDLFRSTNVEQDHGGILLRRSDNFKLIARIPRLNEKDFNQPLPANNLLAKPVADGEECRSSERTANATNLPALLSGHVLVVEDNVVNRMVVESLLTKLGVSVTLAFDGQQALDTITKGDFPDLVLMDLHMPVMDGYTAAEKIRQWECGNNQPRIPIIALTADAYEEDHQHCLTVGMDDFLTKPIALDALKSALYKWLPMPKS